MEEKKIDKIKRTLNEKYQSAKTWCVNNKQVVVAVAPCIIGGIVEITKIAAKKSTVNEERRLKENYIYDRSLGHYYETRRKLKSSEYLQIEQRKNNGEPLGQILNDMRVLK